MPPCRWDDRKRSLLQTTEQVPLHSIVRVRCRCHRKRARRCVGERLRCEQPYRGRAGDKSTPPLSYGGGTPSSGGAHTTARAKGPRLRRRGYSPLQAPRHDNLVCRRRCTHGQVLTQCKRRHGHRELFGFLRAIEDAVPSDLDLHLIVDDYSTHKHVKFKRWLAARPCCPCTSCRPTGPGSIW